MGHALKAPFPYFGGKSTIASLVWNALGQPRHYIEPFFGSGAVLLARPCYQASKHAETVVDLDGHLANVWRSLQAAPDEVARWCDWPVNHCDLSARKRLMIKQEQSLLEQLSQNDTWCDPKLAGYWIWAASCWIGSGMTNLGQRPHVGHGGMGVHTQGSIPQVIHMGKGVHAQGQIPHVSLGGNGVHAQGNIPHVNDEGADVRAPYKTTLYPWFRALSTRLRYVRVICGDWTRVCGGQWQDQMGTVGIFFDPPYGVPNRSNVYKQESSTVAHAVRAWTMARGARPTYRIVLAGYEEHDELAGHGWRKISWTAQGGYSNVGQRSNQNRRRETLWCSPHCLQEQDTLFPVGETPRDGEARDDTASTQEQEAVHEGPWHGGRP